MSVDLQLTRLPELLSLLDLVPAASDCFRAEHSAQARATGHVFGGLVAAQAVVAACRTVPPDRTMHSLHAYFLRAGDPGQPLDLQVRRSRDGRSFSHRRVLALQQGREIVELSCSFATPDEGLAHQAPAPEVAAPEDLPDDWRTLVEVPGYTYPTMTAPSAFAMRSAEPHSRIAREHGERTNRSRTWIKAEGAVRGDPVLHQALLVYASDLMVLDPTVRPHARSLAAADVAPTTIDHAVWFHAPLRADEWWLYDVDSPWAGDGRGFARGRVFDRRGTLVAEVAQEGLIRLPRS